MKKIEIIVKNEVGTRIDKYISDNLKEYSRSYLSKLIDEGNIKVNNKKIKSSYKIIENDIISITIPKTGEVKISPENIELDIVYEDEYFAVINKPINMVVHPTESLTTGTLVNALLANFNCLSDLYLPYRPGIVHRLDKDTTGLVIIAKNNEVHRKFEEIFKERKIEKTYLAIVNGVIKENLELNYPIGRNINDRKKMAVRTDNGKNAITKIYPISYNERYSLILVKIETGRTHQIRVHTKYINHSIVGDKTYGVKSEKIKFNEQLLHAYNLKFKHPINKVPLDIKVKPSDTFKLAIKKLEIPINEFINENIL